MRCSLPPHVSEDHPIVWQEYAVYTSAMDGMIKTIGDWIDQQVPGAYIHGPSRFGKSRCVKWYLIDELEKRFKTKLPVVIWPRIPESNTSEAVFWHNLLLAAHFHFVDPTKVSKKSVSRYRFRELLITLAKAGRGNFIALLIDEAQDMTLREWKWLLGLQNELDWEGYRLTVFSIASHQIRFQPDFLASLGDAHIVARFFASHTSFKGIRSIDEMEYVLRGYDEDSEWPKGSGASFLQHFAPRSFAEGKRLAQCAPKIWQVMEELLPPEFSTDKKLLSNKQYPMQHFIYAIEDALFRLADGQDWNNVTSSDSWLKMIAKTNFTNHMRDIARQT